METPRIETTGRLHHLVTDQIHLDVEYEEGDHSKSNSIFVTFNSGRKVLSISRRRPHRSGNLLQTAFKSTGI